MSCLQIKKRLRKIKGLPKICHTRYQQSPFSVSWANTPHFARLVRVELFVDCYWEHPLTSKGSHETSTRGATDSSRWSHANPLNLSPWSPFLWLPSEPRQPSWGSPGASSMLSPSLFHCPKCIFNAVKKFVFAFSYFLSWLKSFPHEDKYRSLLISLVTQGPWKKW